jgi:hypothetical protein
MKDYVRWFGLLAVLHSGLSHGEDGSPFVTYRPFNADEPLMDWRAANERVREAGGHLGPMKTDKKIEKKADKAEAPAAGSHAGHGSHTPPAGGKK